MPKEKKRVELSLTRINKAHWFSMPDFWTSASKTVKPGGTVAIWTCASLYCRENDSPVENLHLTGPIRELTTMVQIHQLLIAPRSRRRSSILKTMSWGPMNSLAIGSRAISMMTYCYPGPLSLRYLPSQEQNLFVVSGTVTGN